LLKLLSALEFPVPTEVVGPASLRAERKCDGLGIRAMSMFRVLGGDNLCVCWKLSVTLAFP